VRLGPGGLDALVALGAGDMRRTLNILQSSHMAFDELDARAVYATTGAPMPEDIRRVLHWLLNEDFGACFSAIQELQLEKGLALVDIVRELHPLLFDVHLPTAQRGQVLEKLADLEHRLAFGTNERLQLGSLVGAFVLAREAIVAAAR
jgi:replication factor C subunit 3/5